MTVGLFSCLFETDSDSVGLFDIDTDIVCESNFLLKLIDKLDSNPNFGIVTPNTIQFVPDQFDSQSEYSYFDSWALIDNDGNQKISSDIYRIFYIEYYRSTKNELPATNIQFICLEMLICSITLSCIWYLIYIYIHST